MWQMKSSNKVCGAAMRCRMRKPPTSPQDLMKSISICLRNSQRLGVICLALILMATSELASGAAPSRWSSGPAAAGEPTHKRAELYERLRADTAGSYHDLAAADQMEEPTKLDADVDRFSSAGLRHEHSSLDDNYALEAERQSGHADDEAMENSNERTFLNNHHSHLRAMRDLFERRHLNQNHASNSNNNNNERLHSLGQSSQELSPISIGLDPSSPFSMPPFALAGEAGAQAPPPPMMAPHHKAHMSAGAEQLEPAGGPGMGFGLNPLPHLLAFQSGAFDGPQRGDQSAHHAAASSQSQAEPEVGPGQKVWPKIFRFTDGRINLSDFEIQKKINLEKQKKIAMPGGRHENHIESAPIMFDGRPLKRKSFLILHGGFFPRDR